MYAFYKKSHFAAFAILLPLALSLAVAHAQSVGNFGSITGTVLTRPERSSQCQSQNSKSGQRIYPLRDRQRGKVHLHECSIQSLSPHGNRRGLLAYVQDVESVRPYQLPFHVKLQVGGSTQR